MLAPIFVKLAVTSFIVALLIAVSIVAVPFGVFSDELRKKKPSCWFSWLIEWPLRISFILTLLFLAISGVLAVWTVGK